MSLARILATNLDTQTAVISSARPSLFFIRGPRSAVRLLRAHQKRSSHLTSPETPNPPNRVTLRGHTCYVVPPTCSYPYPGVTGSGHVRHATLGGDGVRGVQFMVDETGRKTGVVIDLRKNPELWEDLFDRALVRKRKGEPRETFDAVKRRLVKTGKLSRRASA